MAGTVGAIFNGALQLGPAVGISAIGSIEASVNAAHGGPDSYAGRAAAYWFLLGIVGVEFVGLLVFYRIDKEGTVDDEVLQTAKKLEEAEEVVVNEKLGIAGEDEGCTNGALQDREMDVSEMASAAVDGCTAV